jgi:hypothetical protein
MPIVATDIVYRLSGGAANAAVNSSIGGIMSSTAMVDATVANLFDNVTGDQTAVGYTNYRCFYVRNSHATITWQNVKVWINSNTTSPDSDASIGLDAAAVGNGSTTGVAATPANDTTAPAGVAFTQPTTKAGALTIGDMAPGTAKAIWVKRVVTAGAAAFNADTMVVRTEGDTSA